MDKHDFDSAGLTNSAFVSSMRQNFGPPPKPPAPHDIDTTQVPEDDDRGILYDLGGLATKYGLILGGVALFLCILHQQHGWPF